MESFFSIKNFKSRNAVMEFFLSFRNFKSRKKMTESFFSGHTLLGFQMMHKFPGTIFSLSVPTEFLCLYISFFDYYISLTIFLSLTIYFNLHEERCRANFSKYCKSYFHFPATQMNGFTYIMSEATFRSFSSCSCSKYFREYRRRSLCVSNDCLWKLYL